MPIDRFRLLADTKAHLPSANVLPDETISRIIDVVVDNVIQEDDIIYYNNALCEVLKRCALANHSKTIVDASGKKREKVGQVEVEWNTGESPQSWKNYFQSLKDYCPLVLGVPFGNVSVSLTGIIINPGERLKVSPCERDCDVESIYSNEWNVSDINNDGF